MLIERNHVQMFLKINQKHMHIDAFYKVTSAYIMINYYSLCYNYFHSFARTVLIDYHQNNNN